MANQSKSMVFGFVIIAAIIFAIALGYKMTQDEPAEKATSQPVVEKQAEAETKEQEIKVVSYDKNVADKGVVPTQKEQVETSARAPYFRKFSMRYRNGEAALKDLPYFIENNQDEEAHYLVKYIESQFPETKIPEEFADL